jgi:hypothetical protein
MPIIARDILTQARVILQDGGATRWPLTELVTWLNAGLRELPMRMPSATATNFVLALVAGTKQTLPDAYASLIRVNRNVTGIFPAHVGSMAVTPIVREILDAQNPHWHDPVRTPFRAMVRHVMSDPYDQRTYYVYPGNDGTGQIECLMSAIPVAVAVTGGADPEDIDSYGMSIAVQSIFQSALVDYVLYRAFSKDMQLAGAADRAGAHYGQFTAALDTKAALEGMANVNTTQSQPNS